MLISWVYVLNIETLVALIRDEPDIRPFLIPSFRTDIRLGRIMYKCKKSKYFTLQENLRIDA